MIAIVQGEGIGPFLEKLGQRRGETNREISESVSGIVDSVRRNGDAALVELTKRYDKADLTGRSIRVGAEEIKIALDTADAKLIDALRRAADRIRKFHERCRPQSWLEWEEDGVVLGQRLMPLESVGIYVPGGRAAYPSSLLMAAVPAQTAGVSRIVVVSPPDERGRINSTVLAAAGLLGIDEIYRVGGAQAIAALAYGTETIKSVDKIVGPGNAYVAEAKRRVFGICGIDMIAGPSEVVVLADETADPSFVAADLLAQAEHDPLAASIAVTTDSALAEEIAKAVQDQARTLSRKAILEKSLDSWGGILLAANMDEGIDLVNRIAPEHLGLAIREPWNVLGRIRNAGAIFLGHYAPETVGDYWAGPNHILPTGGTARFASPLSTEDFYKKSSVTYFTREALEKSAGFITRIAEREGLDAHAQAVNRRLQ